MENSRNDLSRRELCKKMMLSVSSAVAAISVAKTGLAADAKKANPAKTASPEIKMADPKGPLESGLKYVEDLSKMNPKPAKRGTVEGKDQLCSKCQMYNKTGTHKGKEVGKCLLIATGAVYANGWCNSWVQKAG